MNFEKRYWNKPTTPADQKAINQTKIQQNSHVLCSAAVSLKTCSNCIVWLQQPDVIPSLLLDSVKLHSEQFSCHTVLYSIYQCLNYSCSV